MNINKLDTLLTHTVNLMMLPPDKKIKMRQNLFSIIAQSCYQYEHDTKFKKQIQVMLKGD